MSNPVDERRARVAAWRERLRSAQEPAEVSEKPSAIVDQWSPEALFASQPSIDGETAAR